LPVVLEIIFSTSHSFFNQDILDITTFFTMIFTNFIAGVIALSIGVNAGPCRPITQSSAAAGSVTTTAETSLATSTILTTTAIDFTTDLTTFITLTAETTSAAEDTTTVEATPTVEATTTAEAVTTQATSAAPEATTSAALASIQCRTNEECDALIDVSGLSCAENNCECQSDFFCHAVAY
jgi:hypothetical protein